MINFEQSIKKLFEETVSRYNLTYIDVNNGEIYIVGYQFALVIGYSVEGSEIFYIRPNGEKKLEEHYMTNIIQDRFTSDDRANYGNPSTNEERVYSELKVISAGLSKWDDLLSGDKIWLNKYKDDKTIANSSTTKILAPIFERQTFTL